MVYRLADQYANSGHGEEDETRPKQLKAALSARKVQTLTKPGSYSDGNGLELHIRETGAKTWALRVMVNGKRVMRGLGSYPAVGLADARALAVEHREALLEGRDIRAERQAEKSSRKAEKEAEDAIPTFSALAATVVELRPPDVEQRPARDAVDGEPTGSRLPGPWREAD